MRHNGYEGSDSSEVSHKTVFNWIRKYSTLMKEYVETLTPNVSETWRADELYVKMKGNQKYLFALMDDETCFWIAQQVADNKGTSDIRPLFQQARERTGKKPMLLITDGAANFAEANMEYQTRYANDTTNHIRDIRFDGSVHNNKMERMNGEVRDREKVMRALSGWTPPS